MHLQSSINQAPRNPDGCCAACVQTLPASMMYEDALFWEEVEPEEDDKAVDDTCATAEDDNA